MPANYNNKIAHEMDLQEDQVQAVSRLITDGATIPFMARYRKEVTGGLDEVVLTSIRDRLNQLEEMDKRREAILKSLEQNGHLTPELHQNIEAAETMAVLEDLYLPFRPKRRTRATIAREKGLEPLARSLFNQTGAEPYRLATDFIDEDRGVTSHEEALTGAVDIMAE